MVSRYTRLLFVVMGLMVGGQVLAMAEPADQGAGAPLVQGCLICSDLKPVAAFIPLEGCGHAEYCQDCWRDIVDERIGRRNLGVIPCSHQQPGDYCNHRLTLQDIRNMTGDDFRNLEFKRIKDEVTSASLEQPLSDEGVIKGITQHCPCCGAIIEKDAGCNEVTCVHCSYQFCWDCLRPFELTGGHLATPQGHGWGQGYVVGEVACQKPSLAPGEGVLDISDQLLRASKYNNSYLARMLLARGALIHAKYKEDGMEALHYAAQNGNVLVARVLIDNGAEIDCQMTDGNTPLVIASYYGCFDFVRYCIGAGAKVNHQIHDGASALMMASLRGHYDIVCLLVRAGACVDHWVNNGSTALIMAAEHGYLDIVKALIAAKADLNHQNDDGTTALIAASSNGHIEVVRKLVVAGANMDLKRFRDGWTALKCASLNTHSDIVQALIMFGANADHMISF